MVCITTPWNALFLLPFLWMVVSSYFAFKLWQVTVGFPFLLLARLYKTSPSCLNLFRERTEGQAIVKVCKNVCREIASPNSTWLGHSEVLLPCGSCGVLLRNGLVPCCAELCLPPSMQALTLNVHNVYNTCSLVLLL